MIYSENQELMETSLLPALKALKEMARKQAAECDRERAIIGFIYGIPPVQLSDEQISKYRQEILMQQYAALIPALKPPIPILHIK